NNMYFGPKDSNQLFSRQMMAHGMKRVCFSNFPDRHNDLWFMAGWEEFHMITAYYASISYVDHYLNEIIEELKRQGVYEETAIIISADHGDAFGEHGI